MTWRRALLEQIRGSFWLLPAIGVLAGVIGGTALPTIDDDVDLHIDIGSTSDPATARAVLQMIVTLTVSVAGISFSVIVVALVLAAQQLSPRVLRSFQRHPLNQVALAGFLGTATFALYVLGRVDAKSSSPVPDVSVAVAMVLSAASLVLFVVFLHHVMRSLNASTVIRRIAAEGHVAVDRPYPAETGDPAADDGAAVDAIRQRHEPAEVTAPRAGYLSTVNGAAIVRHARRHDGFVEQRRAIGDFGVTGSVLAVVWCPPENREALVDCVQRAFVLAEERVVDGDIALPVRQLSDIALKGLSPGINDPTTAENAMDSLADTLVRAAGGPSVPLLRADADGQPRLLATRPSFDALVQLGFDQVRRDGSTRPSFAVRLIELLTELRANAACDAAGPGEIERQADLVARGAVERAELEEDRELIREAHREFARACAR